MVTATETEVEVFSLSGRDALIALTRHAANAPNNRVLVFMPENFDQVRRSKEYSDILLTQEGVTDINLLFIPSGSGEPTDLSPNQAEATHVVFYLRNEQVDMQDGFLLLPNESLFDRILSAVLRTGSKFVFLSIQDARTRKELSNRINPVPCPWSHEQDKKTMSCCNCNIEPFDSEVFYV